MLYVPSMNIGFGITLNCSYESPDHDHDDDVGNGDDTDTDYDNDEYDDVVDVMVMMCMNRRYIILNKDHFRYCRLTTVYEL